MKKLIAMGIATILATSFLFVGCTAKEEKPASTTAKKEEKTYQYYKAEEVKDIVEKNKSAIILDVQVKEDFDKHHIKGAIATYAYPTKTAEDTAKLDAVIPKIKDSKDPVVVVCPGGKGGATRAIDYLVGKGIDKSRFFILEKGQGGWPYENLLEK
ncbi:MAG: rhodanese-like domain-containing protein [Clostridium sp.]